MKNYILTAIIDGKTVRFNHMFKSRDAALDYIFAYYNRHELKNIQVEDEFCINNDKHNIEYVCDYNNRFRIDRVIA